MSSKKSFPWLKWILVVVLLGGAVAGWQWYARTSKTQPLDFKTATVSRGDLIQSVTANGQINPVTNVTVGSQVSGIITEIKVDFNSLVTNGQVIAQIDPATYQQYITQAEADLANATAGLELAQLNFKRAKELRANALVSQSDYDTALVNLHQAEAVVKMRDSALKKVNVDLERTTILSPIDGIVISRNVDIGQTVAASFNTPTLFQIANDLRQMRIEAMVSEADVGGIKEGQRVTFAVDAFLGRQFVGQVSQVRFAPITNQNVVNYTTVIAVNNADLKLRPGMTANTSIITAQRTNALVIPNAALRLRLPTNVVVTGMTNTPAGGGTNKSALASAVPGNAPSMAGRPEGMPVPPWASEGRRPTPEERQKWMQSLTPEQRDQMEKMRERRAQSGEGGGGFGGPGGLGGPSGRGRMTPMGEQEGPVTRTVYLLDKSSSPTAPVVRAVTIKAGIADSTNTEVLEGLKEGDVVVTGINQSLASAGARPAGTSPFGGPFGGGMRPR